MYVNLVLHEDASGISSLSCGPSSFHPPIFYSDEDIMEAMITPYYPWDDMHHCVYFLMQQTNHQYVMQSKDLIHGEVNWFKNSIHALDDFEEGNMANISPTIKFNILNKPRVEENIILGAQYTLEEIEAYTKLFKKLCDVFPWSYSEMLIIDLAIIEHHIDTWHDSIPIH